MFQAQAKISELATRSVAHGFIGKMALEEAQADKSKDYEAKIRDLKDRLDNADDKNKKDKKIAAEKISNLKADLERTRTKAKEQEKRRKEELRKKDETIEKLKKQGIKKEPENAQDWNLIIFDFSS